MQPKSETDSDQSQLMRSSKRLQAEKMSVKSRKREVEESNRDSSRRGRTTELKNKIRKVKESLEEQQHQAATTMKCVCAESRLKRCMERTSVIPMN